VSTRRKRTLVAGGTVVAVVVVLVALLLPGGVQSYTGSKAGAPSWAKPCWTAQPRQDRRLLARCARLRGRVLWVRRQGIGPESKAEMVLAAHFGVVLAKMKPYTDRHVPGIGQYVTIVGPLVRSKTGLREVQFFAQE
jgi:hypothetical protein